MFLAALVLASTLTATTGGIEAPSGEPPAAASVPHAERARQRRAQLRQGLKLVAGIGLEVAAGLFYGVAAQNLADDLRLPSAGCDAPDMPCGIGTPVVMLFPASAIAMGTWGAITFARAREANIWRSPLFWVGNAVAVAALVAGEVGLSARTRNGRVTADIVFLAGGVLSNVLQIWGAAIAPLRETEPGSHALWVAPGCAPTSGGAVCGLALAGF